MLRVAKANQNPAGRIQLEAVDKVASAVIRKKSEKRGSRAPRTISKE
jgi:hypothetical protein